MKYTSYNIESESNLILEKYHNDVSLEDIIKLNRLEQDDVNYDHKFNKLTDLRTAQVNLDFDDIQKLVSFVQSTGVDKFSQKVALLVSNPDQTAKSYMYEHLSKNLTRRYSVVVTLKSALNFLDINLNKIEYFDKKLMEL